MRRLAVWPHVACVVALLVLVAGMARADELEIVGAPPLVVHAPTDRVRVAVDLATRGASEIPRLSAALGLPAPPRIDAYLLPRQGDDEPETFGLPRGPEWAAGIALDHAPVVILRTAEDRGSQGNEVAQTLSHELVHAIMAASLGPRHRDMPAWWREGLATHLSNEWRLVESVHVVGLALSGRFVPLYELEREFPAQGPRVQWAYLESFAFVGWLIDREGPEALPRFFESYTSGASFGEAFTVAFGASPAILEREWKGEFLWRYRWLPVLTSSSTVWLVMVLIFVIAGVGKRRRAARLLEGWAAEEAAGEGARTAESIGRSSSQPGPGYLPVAGAGEAALPLETPASDDEDAPR
jgi:hypothetical protein